MNDYTIKWLDKATRELSPGESFYLPCVNKDDSQRKKADFAKALKTFQEIHPLQFWGVKISSVFQDRRFWLIIKKTALDPNVGFKKSPESKSAERVFLDSEKDISEISKEDLESLKAQDSYNYDNSPTIK